DAHKKPGSAGLISHETYGDRVHRRLELEPINKIHGRRSSNVGEWGQALLDVLQSNGFDNQPDGDRAQLITTLQDELGKILRDILEQDPLEARVRGRSAEAVIRDLLKQAEGKNKAGDVAQYLVAAKLMIRLKRDIKVVAANKAN